MFHYTFVKLFRFKVYFKKILPAPRDARTRHGFGGARARCDLKKKLFLLKELKLILIMILL